MLRDILLNMAGISAVVGLVGLGLIALGRKGRISARWLCICWIILAMRLLIPFNLPISVWNTAPPAIYSAADNEVYGASGEATGTPHSSDTAAALAILSGSTADAKDIITTAAALWLIGAGAFALWHGAGYLLYRRRLCRWSHSADDSTLRTAKAIAEDMHIRQQYTLRVCEKAISPMLMGFIRPIIFIPAGFAEDRLDIALRHELTHLKRGDIWFKLLLTAANAVHCINPMVWLVVSQAEKDIESACDEEVLANATHTQRRAYCEAILDMMCTKRVPLSTTLSNRKEDIMKRFERILSAEPKRGGLLAAAAVLCGSLLLCGLVGCTSPDADIAAQVQAGITAEQTADISSPYAALRSSEDYMNVSAAMEMINRLRAEANVPELCIATPSDGTGLYEAAMLRLEEIKESFSHTRPNGDDFHTVYESSVLSDSYIVEVLGTGQLNADQIVTEWISCPIDAKLLLDEKITHMCVVAGTDDDGQIYWVFAACKL